jgi:membrane-bound acyltransferase YfiQ involved in biofilm formation
MTAWPCYHGARAVVSGCFRRNANTLFRGNAAEIVATPPAVDYAACMIKAAVPHRHAIDLARFIASFGVVVAHVFAMENDWVGNLSLGLFLILAAFLAMQSMQRSGRYPFVARAKKLVLPWLFWSAVFRVVLLKVSDDPGKWQVLSDPYSLLVGSSVHLWFLPFVMGAMTLVEPTGRLIRTPARLIVALAGLLMVSALLFWTREQASLPVPGPQWLYALPVYALGLLLGVAHPMARTFWVVAAAAGMSVVAYVLSGGALWAFTILAAVLVFEAFWRMPWRGAWLPFLGQVAFGIYLVHPFFLLVVYKIYGAEVDRLWAAVLTFAMSWGAVLLLRRLPVFVRLT